MVKVRLLTIPYGQDKDADGRGLGDDWPLLDLGEDEGGHHYVTTNGCHASDLGDDVDGPVSLGAFIVAALNDRPPLVLFDDAAGLWGIQAQMLMAVEECAELQQAILHLGRGRATKEDVADELADVSIMLEQVAHLLGIRDLWRERKAAKLDRLSDRVFKAPRTAKAKGEPNANA